MFLYINQSLRSDSHNTKTILSPSLSGLHSLIEKRVRKMAKSLTLFLLFLQLTYFTAFAEEEFDIGGGWGGGMGGFRMPFIKPAPKGLRLPRNEPGIKDNPPSGNVNHPVPSKPRPYPVENNPPSSHYGYA
jgi:hypothetical protein